MQIHQDTSLLHFNTFGIEAKAANFCEITCIDDLIELKTKNILDPCKLLILGGGSNILFTEDYDGLVLKNSVSGINVLRENDNHVWVKVGSGVVWHNFVIHCIDNDWGGVENLSLIPGTVGAAPMQNIGAYGEEIKNVFESLEAFEISSGDMKIFDNATCDFGYRESIFKHKVKGEYIITSVTFRLSKSDHSLNISYGAIQETLEKNAISRPTIKDVSDAVIEIRQSKLPDPKKIGNAGSFFKNPTIDKIDYEALEAEFPTMPSYQLPGDQFKIPAGWLIEQCGWKGKKIGDIGVHENQALVLVNYGKGKGVEIKKLALEIQKSVSDKFGILLSPEVNFVPPLS